MNVVLGRWRVLAGLCLLAVAVGCGGAAADAHGVFASLFGTKIPAGVKVRHYSYETMGMDPSFAWELAPVDNVFLKQVVASQGLTKAGKDDRPGGVYQWPRWWDAVYVEALPEVYYGESPGLKRVWVDRAKGRMFVEFIGT